MAKLTLYVASSNPGKLRDFSVAAAAHDIAIEPAPAGIEPPAETQDTFEGNAHDKAIYYSSVLPGRLVIADDSGLEVDALAGDPGVRSARYAADAGRIHEEDSKQQIDQRNNAFLLENLAGVPDNQRSGRYRCVLALARSGECLLTASGEVEGMILTEPRGEGGFGYDPLFYLPELRRTMAELDLETKHSLSHRGRAFRTLLQKLLESQI